MPTSLRRTQRTARTRKDCFCCGASIRPGDKYEESVFAYKGTVCSILEHVGCAREASRLLRLWGDDEYDQGYLLTEYDETSPEWRRWYHSRVGLKELWKGLANQFRFVAYRKQFRQRYCLEVT